MTTRHTENIHILKVMLANLPENESASETRNALQAAILAYREKAQDPTLTRDKVMAACKDAAASLDIPFERFIREVHHVVQEQYDKEDVIDWLKTNELDDSDEEVDGIISILREDGFVDPGRKDVWDDRKSLYANIAEAYKVLHPDWSQNHWIFPIR